MRGKRAPKRPIQPDPKYHSTVIAKFTNSILRNGKKLVAQRIVYTALDTVAERTKQDPLDVFNQALKNVTPTVEVRSRRIGGANYQIPVEVRGNRRNALAFRWVIDAARSRKGSPMAQCLAQELIDAANNEGSAVKKREDVHRMAESNRAFAHFV